MRRPAVLVLCALLASGARVEAQGGAGAGAGVVTGSTRAPVSLGGAARAALGKALAQRCAEPAVARALPGVCAHVAGDDSTPSLPALRAAALSDLIGWL